MARWPHAAVEDVIGAGNAPLYSIAMQSTEVPRPEKSYSRFSSITRRT